MAEVVAETERLILRTWDSADEGAFYDVMNTPAVMRWLGGLQTREEWNAAYKRLLGYQSDYGFTFWIMERLSDGAILGFCGLKRLNAPGAEPLAGEIEIGWRLREDAWGQGYAKEAATAALDLAFGRFGALRVVAVTAEQNSASQGLMKRLGMRSWPEMGYTDTRFPPDAAVNPHVVFVIDAAEWPAARLPALS